ncbi:unnamed protein product [Parascedosporium putredinis]|uniref:Uncharacterized protein n=1 Tax=Parascedosporium putredinis TaxID=1442378 RepID=A0A9P1H228_9PEZI|nr:unnamed protein product [Parascedosporium putredinis]CAI7993325.1 unnamed protein product [Parascedosporium putredinis]
MGRWSYLDTDEARLPDGMKRVGYDADTQVYTFLDAHDGTYWESAPGNQYGKLFPPDAELQEGEWEPPTPTSPTGPRRQDSLVRKFIKRWNSVRLSRSSSAASGTLVGEDAAAEKIEYEPDTKMGEAGVYASSPSSIRSSPSSVDICTAAEDTKKSPIAGAGKETE